MTGLVEPKMLETKPHFRFMDTFDFSQFEGDYIKDFQKTLEKTKVVHFKGLPDMSIEELKTFYKNLTLEVGTFVRRNEDYKTGNLMREKDEWVDIRCIESLKTETFRHSDTLQPLHTDRAYYSDFYFNISFFFCLEQAKLGGATIFIDGSFLVDIMQKYEPNLLKDIEKHIVIVDKGTQRSRKDKIIKYENNQPLLCWNYYRVSQENTDEVKQMCEKFQNF